MENEQTTPEENNLPVDVVNTPENETTPETKSENISTGTTEDPQIHNAAVFNSDAINERLGELKKVELTPESKEGGTTMLAEQLPTAKVYEPINSGTGIPSKQYVPEDRNFERVGPDGKPLNPNVSFQGGKAVRREDVVKTKEEEKK